MRVIPDDISGICKSCGAVFMYDKHDYKKRKQYCSEECQMAQTYLRALKRYFDKKGIDGFRFFFHQLQ